MAFALKRLTSRAVRMPAAAPNASLMARRQMSSHGGGHGESLPPRGLKITDPILDPHIEGANEFRDRLADKWKFTAQNSFHLFLWMIVVPAGIWTATKNELIASDKAKGVKGQKYV